VLNENYNLKSQADKFDERFATILTLETGRKYYESERFTFQDDFLPDLVGVRHFLTG
jgi:hypothetical protein